MLKINKLPAKAGIIRFMNHILTAVKLIPRLFLLNNPTSIRLTFPLNPKSVNSAIVGMAVNTKKETLTVHHPCHSEISTSNNLNKRYNE